MSQVSVETTPTRYLAERNIRDWLEVFHADGSIVVFANGARVTSRGVVGAGSRHSLDLLTTELVRGVARDSIAGIQVLREGEKVWASVICTFGSWAVFDGFSVIAATGWWLATVCAVESATGGLSRSLPAGARGTLVYRSEGRSVTRNGELIAASDGAMLVLSSHGLESIPNDAVLRATFSAGAPRVRGRPTPEELTRLATTARYPFGLTDEQVRSLLAALRQDRMVEIVP